MEYFPMENESEGEKRVRSIQLKLGHNFMEAHPVHMVLRKERVAQKHDRLAKYYDTVLAILIIVFALLICIVVKDNFSQISAILIWKMGYVYLCVPISMALIIVFQIINIVEDISKKNKL